MNSEPSRISGKAEKNGQAYALAYTDTRTHAYAHRGRRDVLNAILLC